MTDDSSAARKKRADELRETIRRIKNPPGPAKTPVPGEPAADKPKESPLEFIDRRMRELEEEKERAKAERDRPGDEHSSS
jgi:hypothetical protein